MQVTSGIALPRPAPPRPATLHGQQPHGLGQAQPHAQPQHHGQAQAHARPTRLRASELGTWFEAPCAYGHVRVCVDLTGESAPHAVAAALVLARAEPLLAALDDWIGVDLAWRWVDAPPPAPPGALATMRWHGGDVDCGFAAPWALLRALPAPEPALADRFDWALVPAQISLAQLGLALDELAALEPGGALLLPASLQPPWHGWLRAAGEAGGGVRIDLSQPWRPRLAGPDAAVAATAPDAARIACELRLDLPLGVSGLRLAGWRREGDAGELVHLAAAGLRATLWRCASARHAEHALASGALMPWGDGWALAIESLPGGVESRPTAEGNA